MHPLYANGLTPTSEFPKSGTKSPSVVLRGKLYVSGFLFVSCMTLLSSTAICLLDGPRVGIPAYFASCGVMKIPVDHLSKQTITARDWSCRPIICRFSFMLNVCTVKMGSFKCTIRPLHCLVVGASRAVVVVLHI